MPLVAIDARPLREPPGGIRRHLEELLPELVFAARGARFLLVAPGPLPASAVPDGPFDVRVLPGPSRTLLRPLWEARLARLLARERVDVLLSPYGAVPPGECPTVAMLHDLAFLKDPRTVARRHAPYWRRVARRLPRAAAVVCVSSSVRDDARALLHVPDERLVVALSGTPRGFAAPAADEVARWRVELALPSSFVLAVASWEPRKNVDMLASALAGTTMPLLLVGRPDGSRARRHPHVRQLGRCDDATLRALMATAALVACPSLDEGFGLPVVEAMACGAPVVASHAGAIPEVAGGAALLLPPGEPAAWREAILALARDPERRASMGEAGRRRAAELSWRSTARLTWEAIARAALL